MSQRMVGAFCGVYPVLCSTGCGGPPWALLAVTLTPLPLACLQGWGAKIYKLQAVPGGTVTVGLVHVCLTRGFRFGLVCGLALVLRLAFVCMYAVSV